MIQKSAMTGLTQPQALFRFNQARTRAGAVVEMLEQSDGAWTVSIVWDDGGAVLSHDDLKAFSNPGSTQHTNTDHQLGALSEKFESNGKPGAIGFDSTGGFSYGAYQIASKSGRMLEFIDYLKQAQPAMAAALEVAGGDQAARDGDAAFRQAWTNLASATEFGEAQRDFIAVTHYEPFAKHLRDGLGLDLAQHSQALQDVAWSVAVQHGPNNLIFDRALAGLDVNQIGDADLIRKVYAERSKVDKYFASSTASVKLAVSARFQDELALALQQLA